MIKVAQRPLGLVGTVLWDNSPTICLFVLVDRFRSNSISFVPKKVL